MSENFSIMIANENNTNIQVLFNVHWLLHLNVYSNELSAFWDIILEFAFVFYLESYKWNEIFFFNILYKLYMYIKKNNLLKKIIKPQQSCEIVYAIMLYYYSQFIY